MYVGIQQMYFYNIISYAFFRKIIFNAFLL